MSEKDYYKPIKGKLVEFFRAKVGSAVHLEVIANGKFSNRLKAETPDSINIIFTFLKAKEFAPDITGFIKRSYSSDFIVAEIKDKPTKVDHIYQAKKYSDLLQAKFAFLITTHQIPEEIKRLCKTNHRILFMPSTYEFFALVWFDKETEEFKDWYPENPFEKELYWK